MRINMQDITLAPLMEGYLQRLQSLRDDYREEIARVSQAIEDLRAMCDAETADLNLALAKLLRAKRPLLHLGENYAQVVAEYGDTVQELEQAVGRGNLCSG